MGRESHCLFNSQSFSPRINCLGKLSQKSFPFTPSRRRLSVCYPSSVSRVVVYNLSLRRWSSTVSAPAGRLHHWLTGDGPLSCPLAVDLSILGGGDDLCAHTTPLEETGDLKVRVLYCHVEGLHFLSLMESLSWSWMEKSDVRGLGNVADSGFLCA